MPAPRRLPPEWTPGTLSPTPAANASDDAFFVASRFGFSDGEAGYVSRADIWRQDGTIQIDDVFTVVSRFNQAC